MKAVKTRDKQDERAAEKEPFVGLGRAISPESYRELVDRIDEKREGRGVFYLPLVAGGIEFGLYLTKEFEKRSIPYITAPVYYDRTKKKIVQPTTVEFFKREAELEKNFNGSIKLVWDDSIAKGEGVHAVYTWLRRHDVSHADILISSMIDKIGVTKGLCIIRDYERPVDVQNLYLLLSLEPYGRERFLAVKKLLARLDKLGMSDYSGIADVWHEVEKQTEKRKRNKASWNFVRELYLM